MYPSKLRGLALSESESDRFFFFGDMSVGAMCKVDHLAATRRDFYLQLTLDLLNLVLELFATIVGFEQ